MSQRAPQAPPRLRRARVYSRQASERRIAFWVPDVSSPAVQAEARRQSLALQDDPAEADTLAYIEAISDTDGWR